MASHGGMREGSGRPAGAVNKATSGLKGGVANLKTVPIYQGVNDVFLRPSYATDPDVATTLLDPSG